MMRLNRILVEPIRQQEDLKECWCSRIFIDQTNQFCKKQFRILVHPLIEKKQDPIYLSSQEYFFSFNFSINVRILNDQDIANS